MNNKEYEAAKRLIDIPDVKKGSYSFIGNSTITYADIRNLLDYIKDLEQKNKKYEEVIDKAIKYIEKNMKNVDYTGLYVETYTSWKTIPVILEELLDILKEVK